ncbi:hypothetical protein Hdeb2414_s0006g00209221 [Helianthus debilis subsp. tardiflorus]
MVFAASKNIEESGFDDKKKSWSSLFNIKYPSLINPHKIKHFWMLYKQRVFARCNHDVFG